MIFLRNLSRKHASTCSGSYWKSSRREILVQDLRSLRNSGAYEFEIVIIISFMSFRGTYQMLVETNCIMISTQTMIEKILRMENSKISLFSTIMASPTCLIISRTLISRTMIPMVSILTIARKTDHSDHGTTIHPLSQLQPEPAKSPPRRDKYHKVLPKPCNETTTRTTK